MTISLFGWFTASYIGYSLGWAGFCVLMNHEKHGVDACLHHQILTFIVNIVVWPLLGAAWSIMMARGKKTGLPIAYFTR